MGDGRWEMGEDEDEDEDEDEEDVVVRPAKPMLGKGVPRAMRPVSEGREVGRWSVMKRTVPVALTRERARRRALVGSWVPWEGE
jgi:hypothetical protein